MTKPNRAANFPKTLYIRCAKCLHEYRPAAVRRCPHPTVQKVYGEQICVYCCGGCKYKIQTPYTGALGCGYQEGG